MSSKKFCDKCNNAESKELPVLQNYSGYLEYNGPNKTVKVTFVIVEAPNDFHLCVNCIKNFFDSLDLRPRAVEGNR